MEQETVTCMICDQKFKRITRTHLLHSHNMTTEEYIILYPDSNLICNTLRHQYGKKFRDDNPMHNPASLEKNSQKRRGIPKTEEHKKKLSESQQGEKSHMWGKKREEHAEFMRQKIKKMKEEGTYVPPKQIPWTDERRKQLSEKKRGITPKQNPNRRLTKGMKFNLSDEQRRKRSYNSVISLKNGRRKQDTSIEIKFKDWCLSNQIEFEHQYVLSYKNANWLFDFYIPSLNLMVEIDGEYWHRKRKAINRDIIKQSNAIECGFRFVRISDQNLIFDIINEPDDILKKHTDDIIENRLRLLQS